MVAGARSVTRAPTWPLGMLLVAAAVVLGLVAEHLAHSWEQPAWIPIADLTVGWLLVSCGVIAAVARPEQLAGGRLVVAGFLWFVGTFLGADAPIPRSIGFAFGGYHDLVLVWLALSFPVRRPPSRLAVAALLVATLLFATQSVARLAFSAAESFGVTWIDADAALAIVLRVDVARAAAVMACGLVALVELARSSRSRRREVGLVLAAGAASAFAGGWTAWYALTTLGLVPELSNDLVVPIAWFFNIVRIVVPLAILVGILRFHAARSAIVSAVARVGNRPSPSTLRDALAAALGDPGLRILAWNGGLGRYADGSGDGLTAAAADTLASGEASGGDATGDAILVDDDGERLALIAFGNSRPTDPALVDAGVTLTRLIVRNEQLAVELADRLDEVRASRARIVEAADLERRRIERDLHDGLQQRMVALAMDLQAAQRPGADQAATLDRGAAEILEILNDVRELAQGIHPAVLTEAGLGAAIRAAADRSPVPADVTLGLSGAGSPAAQATAYFVVSEALANVAKHARTASGVWIAASDDGGVLRVAIDDDGPGGADPGGHGLGGLADRVAALDGTFAVGPRSGGGTSVVAEIPVT